MKRPKTLLMLFSFLFLAVQLQSDTSKSISPRLNRLSRADADISLPLHSIYQRIFFYVVSAESELYTYGTDSSALVAKIGKELQIDKSQTSFLMALAKDALQVMKTLDDKAQQIINDAHSRYARSDPKHLTTPICPPELYSLQAQRNDIFLNARTLLENAYGAQKFQSFESRVIQMVSHKKTMIAPAFSKNSKQKRSLALERMPQK